MTITTPWRRMTLHFSQIVFTEGRTFISVSVCSKDAVSLLVSPDDPTPGEVVRSDLHLHAVAREDADAVHAQLAGAVGQYLMAAVELDSEHGVREGLVNDALHHERVFLLLRQVKPP
jgi:hypothetical protein